MIFEVQFPVTGRYLPLIGDLAAFDFPLHRILLPNVEYLCCDQELSNEEGS